MVIHNGYGIIDPQEKEMKLIGYCAHCNQPIYQGYEYCEWQEWWFCDRDHFVKWIGLKEYN